MKRPLTDRRLIQRLVLENLLSFGGNATSVDLQCLNVVIGPNGSGKSNLIEALSLLRATPISGSISDRDPRGIVRRGGGVREWIWKGAEDRPACIDAVVSNPQGTQSLRHRFSFRANGHSFLMEDEFVENERPYGDERDPYFYYKFQKGHPVLNPRQGKTRKLSRENVDPDVSILSQRRDPETYPEIAYLADSYEKIRIYREWTSGRNSAIRYPQPADVRFDRLEEDASNLGLILSRLETTPKAKSALVARLRDLYEGVKDVKVLVQGGTAQIFCVEDEFYMPASRLSDGTLRYLFLLAILCDPEPPPLICIEEPELGLHPDIIPQLADLLVEASGRTQVIVTTHSDVLVNAMTDRPECIVVCEKHEGSTTMQRLDPEALSQWLEKYRLGQLWMSGHIGGTRW